MCSVISNVFIITWSDARYCFFCVAMIFYHSLFGYSVMGGGMTVDSAYVRSMFCRELSKTKNL